MVLLNIHAMLIMSAHVHFMSNINAQSYLRKAKVSTDSSPPREDVRADISCACHMRRPSEIELENK